MDREKITLTGAPETMLATLYGRALDSRSPKSVLHDHAAAEAVKRIDYDFRKAGINKGTAVSVALRAKLLDDWTREFLAAHPSATVLHLACGLDTRAQRLATGEPVRWVDVDYPDVIGLRERLLTPPDGDYRMVPSSVTDEEWLTEIPADRPTVAVFEGLSMYLTEDQARHLIQRIVSRFPSGQLLFDVYGTAGIRMQKAIKAIRNANATLHWGVDDPGVIEAWHPRLHCLDALPSIRMPGMENAPTSSRIVFAIMSHIPRVKDIGSMLRFAF
jgi:O-methyltransferase involved in polyketide biosynthesis